MEPRTWNEAARSRNHDSDSFQLRPNNVYVDVYDLCLLWMHAHFWSSDLATFASFLQLKAAPALAAACSARYVHMLIILSIYLNCSALEVSSAEARL